MSVFDWTDEYTYLEIAMDEQIAQLEKNIKHGSVGIDVFTPKRIVAIWKMLKNEPGALDPLPSIAEQLAKAQEAI